MATSIGTATGYLDLLARLRDFLKNDLGSQSWTQLAGPTSGAVPVDTDVVMRGPGLAGDDEVLVGMRCTQDVATDKQNMGMKGLVSFNPALPLSDQVNATTWKYMSLWNSPIPYWFIANGRRFIVVAKVSTIYQHAYGGFILPYCEPTAWVYPHFMGGTNDQFFRWSVNNDSRHSAYFHPGEFGAQLCFPDTFWEQVRNRTGSTTTPSTGTACYVMPWNDGKVGIRDQLDGGYVLEPAELFCQDRFFGTLGVLDGVYRISGFNNASENTITIGGVTYTVFQNVYRNDNNAYCAIRMN